MDSRRYRSGVVLAIVPAAFLVGALASRALLDHVPARFAIDLAQPITVVTSWGAFGAAMLGALVVPLLIASVAYVKLMKRSATLAVIASTCALSMFFAWLVPAIFSSDVYAYAAYGEMARIGIDPYAHATLSHGDALLEAAIWQWGNPPPVCVYGPAFVSLAQTFVWAPAPLGTVAQLNALRLLACAALLACVPLAYAAYPGDRATRAIAAATIALNPIAIWSAVEGHNDVIAVAIVLAGFACLKNVALRSIGAAIVALSGTIKLPGLLAAVPLVRNDRAVRAGAMAAAAATLLLSIPLFSGVFGHIAPSGHFGPQASLAAIAPIVMLLAIPIALRGLSGLRRAERDGWIWLALAGWAVVPNPYPWYGIWLVALAALAPQTRAAAVAIALSVTSLLRYLPDAAGIPNQPWSAVLGVVASLPFLALFVATKKPQKAFVAAS